MRARFAILILAAASLGGCAYNGLGMGVGYGSPYGYGSYGGYGSPYGYGRYAGYGGYGGYGGYYNPYYSPYGYGGGYGMPYWGWNNGYYYPGTGYYVYDRDRKRRVWTEAEKAYWEQRVQQSSASRGVTKVPNSPSAREIWTDFRRQPTSGQSVTTTSTQRVMTTRPARTQSVERQQQRIERQSTRATARETRRSRRDD